uniref:(California timema) hypothetical protein n=1 Tax=Timema californicum TaxID=61474 RepID=A0A7R9P963_TIMCA|nr:unnamed protein product [Timema californicum]
MNSCARTTLPAGLILREPQYRHQVLTMHQMGGAPRSQQQQMGQQNSANQGQQQQQQQQPQQQQFEDVSTFDFLN